MELISSDTNIWIDFETISYLYVPFTLQDRYQYIISSDTLNLELLSPPDLGTRLLDYGLLPVDISDDEDMLSDIYKKYPDISLFDRVALAIAKNRGIILLTGDGNLRKAAVKENVEVHGTLWVIDEAFSRGKISQSIYRSVLEALLTRPKIRLPKAEITKRLSHLN